MIFVTSDLHFCHDRQFIYKPRGFESIDEMNNAIVENWNNTVGKDDDVYILGDIMLKDNDKGIELLSSLNGYLHIVLGNHDTNTRIDLYKKVHSVFEIEYAIMLRYRKYHFFMTHYPCLTGSLENGKLSQMTLNLFGHMHSKDMFFEDRPYMYNVAMDANNCTPVNLDDVIVRMHDKMDECKEML